MVQDAEDIAVTSVDHVKITRKTKLLQLLVERRLQLTSLLLSQYMAL